MAEANLFDNVGVSDARVLRTQWVGSPTHPWGRM